MKNFIFVLLLIAYLSPSFANSVFVRKNFEWQETPVLFKMGDITYQRYTFEGARTSEKYPSLSFVIEQFDLDGYGDLQVEIINSQFEDFEKIPSPDDALLEDQLVFNTNVYRSRDGYYGKVSFAPMIKNGNRYQRLTSIQLKITLLPKPVVVRRDPPTFTSQLSDGDLFKIAVTDDGIHQLSYSFLKDELGMDIDNIDPRKIQIYGNGGGLLPSYSEAERIDDVQQSHIVVVGEEDGRFDSNDYILFYGEGPHKWVYNETNQEFNRTQNIYDDENHYFIKIGSSNGLRINNQNSVGGADYTTSSYDNYARFEEDKANIMHDWSKTQGSGQEWYGDHFKVAREYSYSNLFSFPGLETNTPVQIKARMILRDGESSSFKMTIAGQQLTSNNASRVTYMTGGFDNITTYAHPASINTELLVTQDNFDIQVEYPRPNLSDADSEAWLDYIQMNVRQTLSMHASQVAFRDIQSISAAVAQYNIAASNSNTIVWDITDPIQPKAQSGNLNGNTFSFAVSTNNSLKEFIAFDSQNGFLSATAVGKVENQNIHGIDNAEFVIIYHPDFESEVLRLAEHRANHSGINVATVTVEQVMNEFASGSLDPTAIRDFARMLYERGSLKYLLLFGDGSFDHKDVYEFGKNFVPIFEEHSLNPIYSFPTDDYYAILYDGDEDDPLESDLSISIGRFPVNTLEQAKVAVDKVISYDSSEEALGDWRNRLIFVGDDEDGSAHSPKANNIADLINNLHTFTNLDKIFLDAYPQVSTPGGDRFPAANAAINEAMFKGVFAVTYLGHGGAQGWAQERVLNTSDIIGWTNQDKLPIFLTATCSFTGFDDVGFTTGGENVFLNPRGGAVALFTTVRAVFANQNAELTEEALRRIYERQDGQITTMGEVISRAKNSFTSVSLTTNSRKFALIGDPSQPVGVPDYNVATTKLNGVDIAQASMDTLRALQRVTVEGNITNDAGELQSNFNGILNITIFDKKTTQTTLGQDPESTVFDYTLQKNVIFKGRASVNAGQFQFTFVIPKDINYQFGEGKISYYAYNPNEVVDAAGYYDDIIIGGTDSNAQADDQGPLVEVFMNTYDFVFGGITSSNPTLLVKLEDDNGINIVGNSIGHDLEGVLDDNTKDIYLLNDFYESELDDYTKGEVRYPLNDLEEGHHRIRVKAWDVANNSAEGYTEFVVAPSGGVALEHVLNYPNPFVDNTCFQFDHNLANQELDILISIYTVSGRLVKTIEHTMFSDGAIRQDDCIQWDGKDDFGDELAKGIYLYKVQVRTANSGGTTLSGESSFEKLVILK